MCIIGLTKEFLQDFTFPIKVNFYYKPKDILKPSKDNQTTLICTITDQNDKKKDLNTKLLGTVYDVNFKSAENVSIENVKKLFQKLIL